MRLLYVSLVPLDFNNLDGVQRKVLSQTRTLTECGFSVDLLTRFNGRIILYDVLQDNIGCNFKGYSKFDVYRAVKQMAGNYSGIYIRYPMSDPFFISMLKVCRKNKMKIIVEIPTYPYDGQMIKSTKKIILDWIDKRFHNKIKPYVDRICTFSLDSEIFGIKTINTINGYNFASVSPSRINPDIKNCINMIAVSGMQILHGYDRLIKGLWQYYQNGGERNLILHIIGTGVVEPEYRNLVDKLGMEQHVKFYGSQFGDKLIKAYSTQALGVNSLAIHRESLERESTLKTREYAAYGLPVLSSSYVDAFSKDGNEKYVLRIPADESPINVKDVISFVDKIYSDREFETIRNEIRTDAEAVCDMAVVMKPVADFFHGA